MQQPHITIQNWQLRASSASQQRGLVERGVKYIVLVSHFTHQVEYSSCYIIFIINSVLKNIQKLFSGYGNLPCISTTKEISAVLVMGSFTIRVAM
jgi:hypothetical protein